MGVTKSEIMEGLVSLGVRPGMMLEVHCSLSSFGMVEGGAPTVIDALKNTVGKEGAIVMPSFTLSPNQPCDDADRELGIKLKIRILTDENEPSAMGIVSDTFRKMPDVVTGRGTFRVSAWGANAEKHSRGFQYLIDSGGYALLLGVDIYRLSAMHYVEDAMPAEIKNRFRAPQKARELYPEDKWFIEAWTPEAKPWYTIQDRAYKKGFITEKTIGKSKCMLLKVKEVIELYRCALQNEAFELYGLK